MQKMRDVSEVPWNKIFALLENSEFLGKVRDRSGVSSGLLMVERRTISRGKYGKLDVWTLTCNKDVLIEISDSVGKMSPRTNGLEIKIAEVQ